MVILFAKRNSQTEKEILKILSFYGINRISDREILMADSPLTVISEYKKTDLEYKKAVAVFCDDTNRFLNQKLPKGTLAVFESSNKSALEIIRANKIAAVNCGTDRKSTVTVSSFEDGCLFASLQRTLTDLNGNELEPCELKIKTEKGFLPFSSLAAATVLLLTGTADCE